MSNNRSPIPQLTLETKLRGDQALLEKLIDIRRDDLQAVKDPALREKIDGYIQRMMELQDYLDEVVRQAEGI